MSRSPGGSKIVDKWLIDVDGIKVVIPLRLRREPAWEEPPFFVKEPEYSLDDEDISQAALKSRVVAHLRQVLQLVWQPFYHVTVADRERDVTAKSCCVRIDFDYNLVEVATKPDGTSCWREFGNKHHSHNGLPETGSGEDWEHAMRALLPATEANELALQQLGGRLQGLSTAMRVWCSPVKIENTLLQVAELTLPAAKAVTAERKKKK